MSPALPALVGLIEVFLLISREVAHIHKIVAGLTTLTLTLTLDGEKTERLHAFVPSMC